MQRDRAAGRARARSGGDRAEIAPRNCTRRKLGHQARLPTSHDSTVYGIARSSTHDFYSHHLAAHSGAVVFADALTVNTYATDMQCKLALGIMP